MVGTILTASESAFVISGTDASKSEQISFRKAHANLQKLVKQEASATTSARSSRDADSDFCDRFLEEFTNSTFLSEMDSLRTLEGVALTQNDLTTLAESIRNIGRSMPVEDRELFMDAAKAHSK